MSNVSRKQVARCENNYLGIYCVSSGNESLGAAASKNILHGVLNKQRNSYLKFKFALSRDSNYYMESRRTGVTFMGS